MRLWSSVPGALFVLAVLVPPAGGGECGDAVPCQCGDVVTGWYRLPADLGPCPGDGLVLAAGAVLDCASHTIRGGGGPPDGATGPAGVGVVLKRTVGALVRNCTVTAFRSGIELRDAQHSTVLGATVVRNGDFRSRVGYGIHLSRSQKNTIMECTVRESADEGIHVGAGSHDNALIGNEVYDNGRENLYVLSANGTQILRNRVGGGVSANLYMKHAAASRVAENRFEKRPVVVRGQSTANLFDHNVFGGGLSFRAYPEWAEDAIGPSTNVVRGGELAGTPACLTFMDASDNRIRDVTLTQCSRVVARSQRLTTNHIVGIQLERIPLDLAGGATLRLLDALQVEIVDPDGKPVPHAVFEMRSDRRKATEAASADADGKAEVLIPTHVVSAASLVSLMPVHLVTRAQGYAPRETLLSDPLPGRLTVKLDATR